MTVFNHLDFLIYIALAFENTVMKSILYVAIFVIVLFLIAGVFKGGSDHGKAGEAVDEFFGYLKTGDFISLKEKYPVFIKFNDSYKLTPQERVEDIRLQQQTAFDEAIEKYDFRDIADVRIENVSRQYLQYELSTGATVTGILLYKNGSTKNFKATLNQNLMNSLMVEEECILNDKCTPIVNS